MPSTYTSNLGLEKPQDGEQDATWGDTVNLNSDIVDQAVAGYAEIQLTTAGDSGSPNVFEIVEGQLSPIRNQFVEFTDVSDLGTDAFIQLTPNTSQRTCHIRNSLSGGRNLVVFQGTYAFSRRIVINNGADMVVLFDGAGTGATVSNAFEALQTGSPISSIEDNGTDIALIIASNNNLLIGTSSEDPVQDLVISGTTGGSFALRDNTDDNEATLTYANDRLSLEAPSSMQMIASATMTLFDIGGVPRIANGTEESPAWIVGTSDPQGTVTAELGSYYTRNDETSPDEPIFYINTNGSSNWQPLDLFEYDNSTGYVGLNTDVPAANLHIFSNNLSPRIQRWEVDLGVNVRSMTLESPTADSSDSPFRWVTNNSFAWEVDGSEVFRLDAQGNVLVPSTTAMGLGVTPSTGSLLEVLSTGQRVADFISSSTTSARISFGDANTSDNTYFQWLGDTFRYVNDNVERLRVEDDGSFFVPSISTTGTGAQGRLWADPNNNYQVKWTPPGGGSPDYVVRNTNVVSNLIIQQDGPSSIIRMRLDGVDVLSLEAAGSTKFHGLASAPSSPTAGEVYYDSTTNKLRCYNGTIWNDLF